MTPNRGNTTLCYRDRLLLVDNLATGFDLYDFPRSSPSFTFRVPMAKRSIKSAVFAEQASVVICGSDHGKIYIFSTGSSEPMQVIKHGGGTTEIQALRVSDCSTFEDVHLPLISGRQYRFNALDLSGYFEFDFRDRYMEKRG